MILHVIASDVPVFFVLFVFFVLLTYELLTHNRPSAIRFHTSVKNNSLPPNDHLLDFTDCFIKFALAVHDLRRAESGIG